MASYNVGQLRRAQIDEYTTDLKYTQGLLANNDSVVEFLDPYLQLSSTVTSLYSYYLKFSVTQLPDYVQKFTIRLRNGDANEPNYQDIRTYTVKQGIESESFELIFNPNTVYNQIVFELSRLAADFLMDNGDGTSGRIMDITIEDLALVENVMDYLTSQYSGLTGLNKIGIQGPPGLLFTMDGEEMRIGKSGIYELYNDDITISYIGFVIKESLFTQDGRDYFIMDFKY